MKKARPLSKIKCCGAATPSARAVFGLLAAPACRKLRRARKRNLRVWRDILRIRLRLVKIFEGRTPDGRAKNFQRLRKRQRVPK